MMAIAAVFALLRGAGDVRAEDLLTNGDFQMCPPGNPWLATNATVTCGGDGASALLSVPATEATFSHSSVAAQAGATYLASIDVGLESGGPVTATLTLRFRDADLAFLGDRQSAAALSGDPATISFEATAPAGAGYVQFELSVTSPASGFTVLGDNASLELLAAPPPTAMPTPTSTPTEAASTTVITPAGSATATPTRTPKPTSTPKATPTPKPGATTQPPAPPPGGSSNSGPTPAPPGPTATPEPAGAWGLLRNGGFEQLDGDAPAHWSKFGGVLGHSPYAHSGAFAATLLSDSAATKWLYQAVAITPGAWYEATAFGKRESGDGEYFIRVSWYASIDGGGSALSQVDSEVSSSASWTALSTGPVKAPLGTRSARFRLMLRPAGGFSVAFDDAGFLPAIEPTPTPPATPTAPGTPTPRAGSAASPTLGPSGTRMPTVTATAEPERARQPAAAAAGAILITEILPDPVTEGQDNDGEWVELYNAGDAPVDLAGWTIADAKSGDILPAYVVAPHSYVVISARAASLPNGTPTIIVTDGRIGSGLNNAGDSVSLTAPDRSHIDAVSYGNDASVLSEPPPAPNEGATLGRLATDAGAKWAMTLEPTPGGPNRFPPEPVVTSTGTGLTPTRPSVAPALAATAQPAATAGAPVVEVASSNSPVPWILLGVAGGVGGLAGLSAIDRRWPGIRRGIGRWRDGG